MKLELRIKDLDSELDTWGTVTSLSVLKSLDLYLVRGPSTMDHWPLTYCFVVSVRETSS